MSSKCVLNYLSVINDIFTWCLRFVHLCSQVVRGEQRSFECKSTENVHHPTYVIENFIETLAIRVRHQIYYIAFLYFYHFICIFNMFLQGYSVFFLVFLWIFLLELSTHIFSSLLCCCLHKLSGHTVAASIFLISAFLSCPFRFYPVPLMVGKYVPPPNFYKKGEKRAMKQKSSKFTSNLLRPPILTMALNVKQRALLSLKL